MKKKIVLLAVALMLFAGVVSASSINGDYQGMPIVKITSGDRVLETDEVPGFIYEGHTVVPISTLRQLGASVTWDAYGYSVDVKLPQNPSEGSLPDINKLSSLLVDEVAYVQFTAMSIDNFTQLSFSLKFDAGDPSQLSKYQKILETVGTPSGIHQIRLEDKSMDGYIRFIKTQNMKDFKDNKITLDEFNARMEIYPKTGSLFPQTTGTPEPQQQQMPVNNSSNVKNGDSGNFQFIGVNDFYDKYDYYHIAGQVKNITGNTMTGGVDVIITLFDQNGNVVGTQSGRAAGAYTLKNGETAPFDIPIYNVPSNYTRYEIKAKS